jgi:hypothetical protein
MKQLTLIGGDSWLEALRSQGTIPEEMLTHLQKISSFAAAYGMGNKDVVFHMPDLTAFLSEVVDIQDVCEDDLSLGAFVHDEDNHTFHYPVPPKSYSKVPLGGVFYKVKRLGMLKKFCRWMKEHYAFSSIGRNLGVDLLPQRTTNSQCLAFQNPAQQRKEFLSSLGRQLITDYEQHLSYPIPTVSAQAVGEMHHALVHNAPLPMHCLTFTEMGGIPSSRKQRAVRNPAKPKSMCLRAR